MRTYKITSMILLVMVLTIPGTLLGQNGRLDVTIHNGTTDAAGRVDQLTLMNLSGGMSTVTQQANASGTVSLTGFQVQEGATYLLQGILDDVSYSSHVEFDGYTGSTELEVFDVSTKPVNMDVASPHIIFKREGDLLIIDRTFELNNMSNPPRTWHPSKEAFRFYLPADHKQLIRLTQQTGTMPLNIQPEATSDPDVSAITTALRPGRTQIALRYTIDYSSETYEYREPLLYDVSEITAIVTPIDMQVSSAILQPGQTDQQSGFKFFEAQNLAMGSELDLTLAGGTPHTAPLAAATDEHDHEAQSSIQPRPFLPLSETWMILLLVLLVMAVSAWMGEAKFRNRPATARAGGPLDTAALGRRRQALVQTLAQLDQQFADKQVNDQLYQSRRSQLKCELIGVMQTLARRS
jgi:hypothetical protein